MSQWIAVVQCRSDSMHDEYVKGVSNFKNWREWAIATPMAYKTEEEAREAFTELGGFNRSFRSVSGRKFTRIKMSMSTYTRKSFRRFINDGLRVTEQVNAETKINADSINLGNTKGASMFEQIYNSTIEKARLFASNYHKGQSYGDGSYYDNHLEVVAEEVHKSLKIPTDVQAGTSFIATAYLHDILEDTRCTKTVLSVFFSAEIVEAVVLLTKERGYDEKEYFSRIRNNELARTVKLADMKCNLRASLDEGDKRRIAKYGRQLPLLFT